MTVARTTTGLLLGSLATLALSTPTSAVATTYATEIVDDGPRPDPAHDITKVATTFDDTSGRLVISVTFRAAPAAGTSAPLSAALLFEKGVCPLAPVGTAGFAAPSGADGATYTQSCRPSANAAPAVTRTASDGGRTVRLEVTDPSLVGLVPHQLAQAALRRGTFSEHDTTPVTRIFAPDAPAALLPARTRLTVDPAGRIVVPLGGVSQRAYARLRLTTPSGRRLATRTLIVAPGLAHFTLRLPKAVRARIGRRATGVRLSGSLDTITATRPLSVELSLIRAPSWG